MFKKILKRLTLFIIGIIISMVILLESVYHYNIAQLKPQKVLPVGLYSEELLDVQWIATGEVGARELEPYSATRFVYEILKIMAGFSHDQESARNIINISGVHVSNSLVKTLEYEQTVLSAKRLDYHLRSLILGIWVSRNYETDEALRVLLDNSYFGETAGKYGIAGVAKEFFQKAASELTLNESLVLMGMQKAPSMNNPAINPERSEKTAKALLEALRKNWPDKYKDRKFTLPVLLN